MSRHLKKSQLNKQKHTSLLIIVPNNTILEKWRSEIEPYAKSSNFSDYVKALKESKSKIKDKLLTMTQNIKTFEDLKKGSRGISWSIILMKRNQLKSLAKSKKYLDVLKNVIGFIIFDEAHHLKEPSIIQAFEDQIHSLLSHKNTPKFLFLTATPFQKSIDQMGTMFSKEYFLSKVKTYKQLREYIGNVQLYLKDQQNNNEEEIKKLIRTKKPIEEKLRRFFVINSKDVFKKTSIKKAEHINGAESPSSGTYEENIQRSKSILNDVPELHDKWNEFQLKYLTYRFNHKAGRRREEDLTRFTSFVVSKHKRKIDDLYPLKLDILRTVIKNHFKPSPKVWNQKVIIFCDMVNDNTTKKDGRLHRELQKVASECIQINPGRNIEPPNLLRVLEKTVNKTVFKERIYYF